MKITWKIVLVVLFMSSGIPAWAQTNTFPGSGNVGIGTTSPISQLTIGGSVSSLTNSSTEAIIQGSEDLSTTAGSYTYPFEIRSKSTNTGRLQIAGYRMFGYSTWAGTGFRLQYAVDNSYTNGAESYIYIGAGNGYGGALSFGTNGADRMFIDNNGHVGIGTKNPTATLAVNGTAKAKEMIVTDNASDWPDYVFQKNYGLPKLNKVEAYVSQKHHLPGIPAKKSIKEKGLNVGDIEKGLVKNQEELTLYIIKQHNIITKLKNHLKIQQQLLNKQQEEIRKMMVLMKHFW